MPRKKNEVCIECGVVKTTANCYTRQIKDRFYFQSLCKKCESDRASLGYRERMSKPELERKVQKYRNILSSLEGTLVKKTVSDAPKESTELMQNEYHILWEIEVTADSVKEAAEIALQIQRDPNSTATIFAVYNKKIGGLVHTVDPSDVSDRWSDTDWRNEVFNGYTKLGYEDWVAHNEESRLDSVTNNSEMI